MTTTVQKLWSLMHTSDFWIAFLRTVRGWALGLSSRDRARSPDRDLPRLDEFADARSACRSSSCADPVGRADPGALPDARHDAQERGLPRDVRRVLAAPDPDDLRRARRRPARGRHWPLVPPRPLRAPLPHHAAERGAVHHDRRPISSQSRSSSRSRRAVHGRPASARRSTTRRRTA